MKIETYFVYKEIVDCLSHQLSSSQHKLVHHRTDKPFVVNDDVYRVINERLSDKHIENIITILFNEQQLTLKLCTDYSESKKARQIFGFDVYRSQSKVLRHPATK